MGRPLVPLLSRLIRRYYNNAAKESAARGFVGIPLAIPQFGADEVVEAMDSLLSGWVTMGEKVKRFEEAFSKYIGTKGAVMVNSGSSANLLALSSLSSPRYRDRIRPGDEVICPAVTWPTTVYPIGFFRANPVFVDVDAKTLNTTREYVEGAVTRKTKAVMVAHLMGNPAEIDKIREFAEAKGLHVIEDACEAHGARIGNRLVGSFGTCSLFSFFLSHHITTIEGGIVLSDDQELLEILTSQRAHGWIREMRSSSAISKRYGHIDKRFFFYETGFNLRPTEIQGAFGIRQLPKLKTYVVLRRKIAKDWNRRLRQFKDFLILPEERHGTTHSYFAYPIIITDDAPFTRDDFMKFLETRRIATRPVAGGNLTEQPSAELYRYKKAGKLPNAERGMRRSFFIGLHHGIHKEQQDYLVRCFEEFFSTRVRR